MPGGRDRLGYQRPRDDGSVLRRRNDHRPRRRPRPAITADSARAATNQVGLVDAVADRACGRREPGAHRAAGFRASGVRDLGDLPPPASADTSDMSRNRHLMSQPGAGTSASASSLRASCAHLLRGAVGSPTPSRSLCGRSGSSCIREAGPRRPLLRATGRLRDRDGWSGPWFATGPGRDGLRRATVPA